MDMVIGQVAVATAYVPAVAGTADSPGTPAEPADLQITIAGETITKDRLWVPPSYCPQDVDGVDVPVLSTGERVVLLTADQQSYYLIGGFGRYG